MSNKGVTLQDIEYWTLEDVEKFNALLDMEQDHQAAQRMYMTPKKEGE